MIEIKAFGSSSAGNCYWVTDGHTQLLLEAGIKFRDIQIGLNFRTSLIAGCLISHEHGDHSKCLKDILKAGIDVYASEGTFQALHTRNHRTKPIEAKKQFQIGTWTVLPFDTEHDAAESLGFLLANQAGEKLLFITDSFYCKYTFSGITHLMIECNFSLEILNKNIAEGRVPFAMKKRLMRSHFSLENVKDFLKANDLSKVEEIWLLHLSDTNSNAESFKEEIQKVTGKMIFVP